MSPSIIYLAAPYTHTDPKVREIRFERTTHIAARLIAGGKIVYSPLTMTHPIDRLLADENQTLGSDYWVSFDEAFMRCCSELYVLMLDGWRDSSGVRREIEFFQRSNRAIKYLDPLDPSLT